MNRPLLVFAHRGEAQAFFKNFSYISLDSTDEFKKNKIFCFKQCFIILTGSSIKKNQELLSQALTKFEEDISHVILLGFAGSLRENQQELLVAGSSAAESSVAELPTAEPPTTAASSVAEAPAAESPAAVPPATIGQTFFIKRVLATDALSEKLKPLKQCFYSNHPEAHTELLTHTKVVNDKKTKTQLGLFADLVDLELYWQAKTVEQFSLPCFFLKVVSDYADHNTSKENVLKNSLALSQKLFAAAKKIISPAKIDHFIEGLEKNKTINNPIGVENLLRKNIQKKSKILIEQLEKKINDNLSYNLSYSNKTKLQECIINDFRNLYTKQNSFSDIEKEVEKKWNLPKNNKICFETFLSKKTQKNIH